MFLGIYLLSLIFILSFIIWLFLYGIKNKHSIKGKIILSIYFITVLLITYEFLNQKMILDKYDYYGDYIVNKNYFKGKQADWQYEHFRFTITKNDSIFFYLTEKEKIIKVYKGTISTKIPYNHSERLVINMEQPTHHILTTNPTTYRNAWDFILVFKSPKFNNVYFHKGKWKPIRQHN